MRYTATVGTYTRNGGQGLYNCEVTIGETVSIDRTSITYHQENPSFLAVHPDKPILYAVHEVENGRVSSYHIGDEGELTERNQQSSGAAGPCYCSVHPDGQILFVANYEGGVVSMVPIQSDGSLDEPVNSVVHEGSGSNSDRQDRPHPHAAVCGPNGEFLYVPDLGIDQVVIYDIDTAAESIERKGSVRTPSGAGPRHIDFHPTKPLAYLITEIDSTIIAYEWGESSGALSEIGTFSTLPTESREGNQASEISVHPSGNWVYGANRGHDSIAVAEIQSSGRLELIETVSTAGAWPRCFTIDPSGEVLLVMNQKSGNVIPFRINASDGTLIEAANRLDIPSPTCLRFLR